LEESVFLKKIALTVILGIEIQSLDFTFQFIPTLDHYS